MGEGFGDYLAASFFFDRKPAAMRSTVGNWDATAYSGASPPFLRRLDSNKLYPRDLVNEPHADGEIWSAALWQIRSELGRHKADQLIIAHHFLLSPGSEFEEAAKALITADKQLNGGRNRQTIEEVFIARGILPNLKRGKLRAGSTIQQIHANGSQRRRTGKPRRLK